MEQKEFIEHFPTCPICKTKVTAKETIHALVSCDKWCLFLNFNGKFINFLPDHEDNYYLLYNTETGDAMIHQNEFPYEREDIGHFELEDIKKKISAYIPPEKKPLTILGRYFTCKE